MCSIYLCAYIHTCELRSSRLYTSELLPAELSSPPILKKILYVKYEHLYFGLHRHLPLDADATSVIVDKAPRRKGSTSPGGKAEGLL